MKIPTKLDGGVDRGHPCGVKFSILFSPLVAMVLVGSIASAQDTPPPLAPLPKVAKETGQPAPVIASLAPADVVASAVAAVANLGDQVVLGRFQVALERMNPLWKERTANQMKGGVQELEGQLAGVARQMVQNGISIISFKPQGQPRSFEVSPGKKVEKVNGEEVESLIYTKWLVLIPTVTKFRITQKLENQAPKTYTIDSIGFQVAITEKGKNDWTFIDGSGLTVNALRGIFGTLPQDLQFPPLEKHESR